jgi:RNA polymerase sporulation-specific sigma factor
MTADARNRRDLALIRAFREGQYEAAERLLSLYKPMVRSKAGTFFLPGSDRDDLLQEGMLGLYTAISRYEEEKGSFAAFASVVVSNHLRDAVKKATRLAQQPLNESIGFEDVGEPVTDRENPEEQMIDREELEALREFLFNRLSCYERKVAKLHQAGYRYKEIAILTDTNVKSVDNALSRVRRKFRKQQSNAHD